MGTVSKAMSLLALFTEKQLELGLSEIARISKMDKATAHRSLTALRDAGLLEQFGPDKLYRIGPEVLRLANIREAAVPFLACARTAAQELCEKTNETAHISLLRGKSLISVAHHYSRKQAIGIMMGNEDSHPLHATSSGLAVLSFAPASLVKSVLSKPLPRYTEHTITAPDVIREKLQAVQNCGYAESTGGFEAGVHSFSAPLFGRDAKVIGAISIAAPSTRINDQERARLPALVMAAATDLTRETGGITPPEFAKLTLKAA